MLQAILWSTWAEDGTWKQITERSYGHLDG